MRNVQFSVKRVINKPFTLFIVCIILNQPHLETKKPGAATYIARLSFNYFFCIITFTMDILELVGWLVVLGLTAL